MEPNANVSLDCIEGPEAYRRFDATIGALLTVPHATLARRERAYRKKVEANPNRRGPKRRVPPKDEGGL
jgi:hypothetical protein